MRLYGIPNPLEGWRRNERIQIRVVLSLGLVVSLLLTPMDGYKWFGLAILGLAFFHVGLRALLASVSQRCASKWLEETRPDNMRYRHPPRAVLLLGFSMAFLLEAYGLSLGSP
jgi:hypothetical protein